VGHRPPASGRLWGRRGLLCRGQWGRLPSASVSVRRRTGPDEADRGHAGHGGSPPPRTIPARPGETGPSLRPLPANGGSNRGSPAGAGVTGPVSGRLRWCGVRSWPAPSRQIPAGTAPRPASKRGILVLVRTPLFVATGTQEAASPLQPGGRPQPVTPGILPAGSLPLWSSAPRKIGTVHGYA
jgi:hypothetical protein